MNIFERLKADCSVAWMNYTQHDFVKALGDGSLPEQAFQNYLKQDYLFLIHYARAFSLAGAKSVKIEDLKHATDGVSSIVNTEIKLHISYCKHWKISEKDLTNTNESIECVAYSRFVLDKGFQGNLLDLYTALAPCMTGYAEIGLTLKSIGTGSNFYQSWIDMYSSVEFQNAALGEINYLNMLGSREDISETRYKELKSTFHHACQLEADFWSSFIPKKPRKQVAT